MCVGLFSCEQKWQITCKFVTATLDNNALSQADIGLQHPSLLMEGSTLLVVLAGMAQPVLLHYLEAAADGSIVLLVSHSCEMGIWDPAHDCCMADEACR